VSFQEPHELHVRRAGRNKAVGLLLAGFIVLLFALSVVKVTSGGSLEAFDHAPMDSKVVEDG